MCHAGFLPGGEVNTTQRHNHSRLNSNESYMAPQRRHYQGFNCTLEEAETAIGRLYALGAKQVGAGQTLGGTGGAATHGSSVVWQQINFGSEL